MGRQAISCSLTANLKVEAFLDRSIELCRALSAIQHASDTQGASLERRLLSKSSVCDPAQSRISGIRAGVEGGDRTAPQSEIYVMGSSASSRVLDHSARMQ